MIFLSLSWQTKPIAHKLVETLMSEYLPCWFREHGLKSGTGLNVDLRSAILHSDIYLFLLPDGTSASKRAQEELQYALTLESEGKLKVVPVSLTDEGGSLQDLLPGRDYMKFDSTRGGVRRLAHEISRISESKRLTENCQLAITIRLEEHGVVHALDKMREFTKDFDIGVMLLNSKYELLDEIYWSLADTESRIAKIDDPKAQIVLAEMLEELRQRSHRIFGEIPQVCRRFLAADTGDNYSSYFDAGYTRAIHAMLYDLQWSITYLRAFHGVEYPRQEFYNARCLPEAFDGHPCDFVLNQRKIGIAKVPPHGYPYYGIVKGVQPWGLTSPFADMQPSEVGMAVGGFIAQRFISNVPSQPTVEMPPPLSLRYGLS